MDPDVVRLMPAEQNAEYDRLTQRVEEANERAAFHLAFWQHWLIELETTVCWFHSLRAWEARMQRLKAALPAKERANFEALLGPAPLARWGVAHGLDLLYGYVLPDEREERGVSLDELPEAVANAVAVGLTYRHCEARSARRQRSCWRCTKRRWCSSSLALLGSRRTTT